MIDLHKEMVSALSTVLPTHYELALTANTKTPCISYMEISNVTSAFGDTQEYARIQYQIKVWAHDIEQIQKYALMVDVVMRTLGFHRAGSTELHDTNSTMIQKVFTFEALANEVFNNGG